MRPAVIDRGRSRLCQQSILVVGLRGFIVHPEFMFA
jgi:hypothetical protein